ncbi:hypothetical protein ACFQ10_18180 [Streptomyces indonesiensis]
MSTVAISIVVVVAVVLAAALIIRVVRAGAAVGNAFCDAASGPSTN